MARAALRAADPKFHAGLDPLQQEHDLHVIQPTTKEQLRSMAKMMEDLYRQPGNQTPEARNAYEFWKMQIASENVSDLVKFNFLRRFYFWLLGRGTKEEHDKTLWGRANTAVWNPEVAAYIDQFTSKRTQYALKLAMLANRVPSGLVGHYLYFKVSRCHSVILSFLLTPPAVHCERRAEAGEA